MPEIHMKPDTLWKEVDRFEQAPLKQPVFLNSVPKSGSHLLRNIIRMFVANEQHYTKQFIQYGNLSEHAHAIDARKPMLSWGHLFFSDASVIETAQARKILLVRDPYDWVLARARFFVSSEFRGNVEHLRSGSLSVDDLLSIMIFGLPNSAPPMEDIFTLNAVAWLGSAIHLVRYEELVGALKKLESDESAQYFSTLLDACGIEKPQDWLERVKIGSAREHSATARERLNLPDMEFPDQLPEKHRALVNYAAPGLRAMLGYS
ncbi:hypothetical protein [Pseudonocardia sp. TMWB2A]|uniref:hypothetical protein n=1 Tax=Pseudonocardia sp. TMWB2A TaxID=687430 RepID=UPI00307E6F1C